MSVDLGTRTYLNVRPELGKWYVSNPNPTLRGIGAAPRKSLRECIIAGPFNSDVEAADWKSEQRGNHLESIVWQQEVAS